MRSRYERDVLRFHRKFEFPVERGQVTHTQKAHRKRMIMEEAQELCEAIDSGDLVAIAREAVDLIYIAVGVFVMYGMPLRPCWRAVHRANMRKESDPTSLKPMKPAGWVSPRSAVVRVLRRIFPQDRL